MNTKLDQKVKHFISEYKLGDFFRNLIAVVLGIIITFIGSDMLAEHNTKKEVKRALQLVKNELIKNRETMMDAQNTLKYEKRAARFLLKNKNHLSSIPKDSFDLYCHVPFFWSTVHYTSDALELLKNSSLFQKISDEQLSLQLIKTYGSIQEAAAVFKIFYDQKQELNNKFDDNPKIKSFLMTESSDLDIWNFLFSTPEGYTFVKQIPEIIGGEEPFGGKLEEIDKAIQAIEDYK